MALNKNHRREHSPTYSFIVEFTLSSDMVLCISYRRFFKLQNCVKKLMFSQQDQHLAVLRPSVSHQHLVWQDKAYHNLLNSQCPKILKSELLLPIFPLHSWSGLVPWWQLRNTMLFPFCMYWGRVWTSTLSQRMDHFIHLSLPVESASVKRLDSPFCFNLITIARYCYMGVKNDL